MHAFRYASGIGPSASAAESVIDTDASAVPSTFRTAGQLLAVASGERSAAPPTGPAREQLIVTALNRSP